MSGLQILIVVSVLITYVVGISGVTDYIRRFSNLSDPKFDKPLFCSRCQIFWAGVILYIIYSDIWILVWACLFSYLSKIIINIALYLEEKTDQII